MMQFKLIAALVGFIAFMGAMLLYGHYQYANGVKVTTLVYETAISKQKNDAAQQLAAATVAVEVKEQALQAAKTKQDIIDVQHTQTVSTLSNQLRDALNANVRLCDPVTGCGSGSGSANSAIASGAYAGANNTPNANGLLSTNFANVLERLTLQADTINNAYDACRADALTIRGISQ